MLLTTATMRIINPPNVTHFFCDGILDVQLVLVAIERKRKVYWTYLDGIMEEPLLWYDWKPGRVAGLPIRDCEEVTMTPSNTLANCCVSLFPPLGVRMSRPAEMKIEAARREAKNGAVPHIYPGDRRRRRRRRRPRRRPTRCRPYPVIPGPESDV